MRVLALYDSRFGFSLKCLQLLQGSCSSEVDLTLRSIAANAPFDPGPWDALVVGGPIYHGRFRPELRKFLTEHRDRWAAFPTLHVFAVGLSTKSTALTILDRETARLGANRTASWFFGGKLAWPQLGVADRLWLRLTRGLENEVSNLDLSEIQTLAAALAKL